MAENLWRKRIVVTIGGAALIGMGVITAGCGENNKEAPTTTTTTTTPTTTTATTPPPAPTEKGGPVQDDPFSPTPPTHTQNRHHGDH